MERLRREPRSGRARWWTQLLVIGWLAWIYDLTTNLAPVREHAATVHGFAVLHLERVLHVDPELALNQWLAGHRTLALLASDYYDNAHFAVTLGVLAWLWWRRPDIYPTMRNALVLINVIAFAVFWRYPVAPPRLLAGSAFADLVADTHAFGSFHSGTLASEANQLAAMPSLHLAWAAWSGLAIWRLWPCRPGAALAVGYPLFTAVVVMATGNHYLADVLAGVLTMGVAVAAAHVLGRLRRRAGPGRGSPLPGSPGRASPAERGRRRTSPSGSSARATSAAK